MLSRISCVRGLSRSFGLWAQVPTTPPDPILGLNAKFQESQDPRKVNLTIGAYRDESGKPWILPSVREGMKRVYESTKDLEYIPIIGDKEFIKLAIGTAYGRNSKAIAEGRVAGAQTLSGCGAVYMGAIFLKKFWPGKELAIYTTTPTWPIHNTLLKINGIKNLEMPYYDPKTKGLDFQRMMDCIEKAPERSVFMLHSCAHNPTGVDPTPEQWKQIGQAFKKKNHFSFFDMAYQGFASGDLERDNLTLRLWEELGLEFCVAQSFAKSMGMYGHRLGAFSIVCENAAEARQAESQLATIARNTWSSPPRYGSDVAKHVLSDPQLYQQWLKDLKTMSNRIQNMRQSLVKELKAVGNPHKWNHITDQIGMFAYTGIPEPACQDLMNKHAVFLTMNGRISVAGLNEKNVQYVAKAFDTVTRNIKF